MHPSTSTQERSQMDSAITKYVYLRGLCLGNERAAPHDDDDDDDETLATKNAHETP